MLGGGQDIFATRQRLKLDPAQALPSRGLQSSGGR